MHIQKKILLFPYLLIFLEIAIFLSNDMYLPSMPAIAQDLGFTQQQIQYTLTLWFLGSGSLQVILGPVSDRYGRRVVVLLGGLFYVISTAICAIAQTLPIFLSARFVQGATICAVLVAGTAAVHELFDTKMAVKIFALISAVTILAPAFGPLGGAIIVQYASWRDIFWLLFALGLISTVLLYFYMPESNAKQHKINLKSLLLDYFKLVSNKDYMLPSLSYCLLISIFFMWMFVTPFLMIETYGTSNLYYGISQAFIFGCFFIGAQLTNWILNAHDLQRLIKIALIILVFGTILFAFIARVYDSMLMSIICMMIISTGASMLFAPLSRISIEASTQPMGKRTAISSTLVSLFGALTGWIVAVVTIQTLASVAGMILVFVALATICAIFSKVGPKI